MALKKKPKENVIELRRGPAPESAHDGGNHDESNWLVSYADMMTLLCGFFVMLFSMANLDEPKYESMKASVAEKFGGIYVAPSAELEKLVTAFMEEAAQDKNIEVKSDAFGVTVSFQSTVFFDTMGSDVKPEGQILLDRLIGIVAIQQQKDSKLYRIVVEGHTDSRPIIGGIYPSNWELSGARAARVVRMFLEKGFHPERLTAIGYADTHPVSPERTPAGTWNEEALSKNRRVVIRILEPKVLSIPLPATSAH